LPGSEPKQNLTAIAARLAEAVRSAGRLALDASRKPVKSWVKAKNSPVSEVDIAVDALLKARLEAIVPEAAWLSEETEDDPTRLSARRVWIVDPIDGTRAFLAGRADWTVSVALVEEGRPIVAALYAPASEEFFLAVAGASVTRNGLAIRASAGEALAGARISGPKRLLDPLVTAAPDIVIEPRVHSLALRLARVADSTFDVAFAGGDSHDWDLAAADLLVHEAGGALTTLEGATLSYNGATSTHGMLVAAGCQRHRTLRALLCASNALLRG
jgi:myo-inositol-1(or 4)-monophosphatase